MKSSVKIVALFLLLMGGLLNASAQERLPQFLKHKVKPGETINAIAEQYKVNKYDLLLLNDFPEEVLLTTNQVILIRLLKDGEEAAALPADYKDGKATTEKKTTTVTATNTTASTETPKKTEAPKKTEPAATTEPVKPAKTEPAPVTVVNKAEAVGPDGTKYKVAESGYHTVEKGQTFYRIALIYGLSVDELKALNNLANTTISVGQKLRVSK